MMQTHSFKTQCAWTPIALAIALAIVIGAAVPAAAQQPPPPAQQAPPAAQEQAKSADVSDKELKDFVGAFEEVQVIRVELNQKLQSTQDPNAATELQRQANAEMLEAVEDNGLDAPRYNAISRGLTSDEQLAARFQQEREDQASN